MKGAFVAVCACLLLVGCATGDDAADEEIDPRQGASLSQICFKYQLRDWRPLEGQSIIVIKNRKEEYRLDLIGSCEPEKAIRNLTMAPRKGGGSCLQAGDALQGDGRSGGSCAVRRIYEWDETKKPVESEANTQP